MKIDALPDSEIKGIKRRLAKGDIVFRQGETVENIHLVMRGGIRLVRDTEDGNPVLLQLALAGDILAGASLFATRYHCTALASNNETEIISYDKRELLEFLRRDSDACIRLMEILAGQIHCLRSLLEIRNIRSARGRILAWIRLEARGAHEVILDTTYKDMASQLGLAHETFYRALNKLEIEGRIVRGKRNIRILHEYD